MPHTPLAIRRYWTPIEVGSPNFGFDLDDSDWFRLVIAPDTRRLDEYASVPCLLLLGEPGMGKSTVVRAEVDRLQATDTQDVVTLLFDLATVSSDAALDEIFQHETVSTWRSGEGVLQLFLDSYDESLRHYPSLKARLLLRLRDLPLERLRLRIATRFGDFIGVLSDELRDLWPADNSQTTIARSLRLEPLHHRAVVAWANAADVDGEAFLRTVEQRNAQSFVARPITLPALIEQYRQGQFPQSEVELFKASMVALCQEVNRDRTGEPELVEEQRLLLAERIAILCTVSGRELIWLGPRGTVPTDVLQLDDVVGGQECTSEIAVDADRHSIRETLGTALFGVHDAQTVRWSQQVYREFLAAQYFARRFSDVPAAMQFLEHGRHPSHLGRKIAAQLAEPAAWLAAMNDGVASWVAEHDPAILLTSAHHIPEALRPLLIDWWLNAEVSGHEIDVRLWVERVQVHLIHPDLADQLIPWLRNAAATLPARALAADLAGAAKLQSLHDLLVELALTDCEPTSLRWRILRALSELPPNDSRAQLRALLDVPDEDVRDLHRMKAFALKALWPGHLSTPESLAALEQHKIAAGDEYANNFESHFVSKIPVEELADVLHWLSERVDSSPEKLESLTVEVAIRAAAHLNVPAVRNALAKSLVVRVLEHTYFTYRQRNIQEVLGNQAEEHRKAFADAVAQAVGDGDPFELTEWIEGLQLPYAFMLDRVLNGPPDQRLWFAALRMDSRTHHDPAARDQLQRAGPANNQEALARVQALFETIEQRAADVELQRQVPTELAPEIPRHSRQEGIARWLAVADGDIVRGWIELGRHLNLDEASGSWILEYVLSETPGWLEASADTRARITETALRYLRDVPQHFHAHRWDSRVATAGFQALLLLLDVDEDRLNGFTPAVWAFWLPGIITNGSGLSDLDPLFRLVGKGYHQAPDQLLAEARVLFTLEEPVMRATNVALAFEASWNEAIAKAFVDLLDVGGTDELPLASTRALLEVLLRQDQTRSTALALSWCQQFAVERERALLAAQQIVLHATSSIVETLMDLLRLQPDLAREVFLRAAPQDDSRRVPRQPLSLQTLVALYLMMADLFPPEEDSQPRQGVFREVEPRDIAAEMRDRFLRQIGRFGTWEALDAIESVIAQHPAHTYPRVLRAELEDTALRTSWSPIVPTRAVLNVASDQQRRILRNSDQLLELVLASLGRLQTEITKGAVADLWSQWTWNRKWYYRPKRELAISDYIKRHLDRDLKRYAIVTNREVENRPGNETDILVQFVGSSEDRITLSVVLEVKGCWHDDLLTALDEQLARRYLVDYEADRGIYVVAWFNCDRWDSTDGACGKPRDYSLASLTNVLNQQAEAVSSSDRRVEAFVLNAEWPWPQHPRDETELPPA